MNTAIKRKVFYSFHFGNDVMRVQLVRQMGAIEGNEPVSANAWEEVKRKGEASIKNWIDSTMEGKSCVVVLIGTETGERPWVKHEIRRAWELNKAILGVHIHNLKCARNGTCSKGANPFTQFTFKKADGTIFVPDVYNPSVNDAYGDISRNLAGWIETAIARQR